MTENRYVSSVVDSDNQSAVVTAILQNINSLYWFKRMIIFFVTNLVLSGFAKFVQYKKV